jgi:Na+-transporting NADH:ubiquinone oxidoreductase subunit NqrB
LVFESYSRTALAIIIALVIELVLGRIFWGQWPNLASAYVSGISVGILVRSPAFWPYALCSALSITSKYVLRVKGRHLWNPSNFGICVMLVLAPDVVASLSIQWGNYLLPMIICVDLRLVHHLAGEAVSHLRYVRGSFLLWPTCAAGSPAIRSWRRSPQSPGRCISSLSFS